MTFAWGLIGPGAIARRFADALRGLPDARLARVWGRDPARAAAWVTEAMAGHPAAPRVCASLHELLADPAIDAVYIATPHDSHARYAHACLSAGKPVLCEKPLTPCLVQTQALVNLAQERQVFLMEALWTLLLPLYGQVRQWLRDGLVGDLVAMESSFCFETPYRPESRLYNPQLAGGTLLDIGIYNLAVTRLALAATRGHCPDPIAWEAQGWLAPTGVDRCVEAELVFEGGTVSRFICAFDRRAENAFRIQGTRGEIRVPGNFWQATEATLLRQGQDPVESRHPWAVNGFEYEIAEAMRAVREGRTECPALPHGESLALVRWLDTLRARVGVRYPFEDAVQPA